MGTVRWRHGGSILFVAYTGQGKHLLTACSDGFFHVWDAATGKEIRRFTRAESERGEIGKAPRAVYLSPSRKFACSDDGATLAFIGVDGNVRIWNVATGKETRKIPVPQSESSPGFVFAGSAILALSHDGKTLAMQGIDQSIRLWDVDTGKEAREIRKPVSGPRAVRFFSVLRAGNPLAFSLDGKILAAVDLATNDMKMPDATIRLYEVANGKELRAIKVPAPAIIRSGGLQFAPDNASICWCAGGSVQLFDIRSGQKRWEHDLRNPAMAPEMVFAPGGRVLSVRPLGNSGIQLLDATTGAELRQVGVVRGRVQTFTAFVRSASAATPQLVAFSADGKVLAEGTSGTVLRFWDVAGGKEILDIPGSQHNGVADLAVTPDGKTLTTYEGERGFVQWELATGKQLRRFELPRAIDIVLAGGGHMAAQLEITGTIELWDLAAGKSIRTFNVPLPQNRPFVGGARLAVSRDGKVVAVQAADQVIRVFDAGTGKGLAELSEGQDNMAGKGGVGFPRSMFLRGAGPVLSHDGQAVAAAEGGMPAMRKGFALKSPIRADAIRLWRIGRGRKPRRFDVEKTGIAGLTFSPDARIIASDNGDGSISLWETLTGKEVARLKGKTESPLIRRAVVAPNALAISPDGRTLANGHPDGSVHLWNLYSGEELGAFTGHLSAVLSVAFAPDNRTVISGSADTTALVWDAGPLIQGNHSAAKLGMDDWNDLAADPKTAFRAVTVFASNPRDALELLQQIKPAPGVDPKHLAQLVADLDSVDFKSRQQANAALEKLGDLAEPALRMALENNPSLETRRRVERLLDLILGDQPPPAQVQRALRGVWILEQIATPEARRLLQTLAAGAPGHRLTRDAQGALKRLGS
jgi:WD40 repeat protein